MPRPDNMDQYRYGAYDYRTAAEDRRLEAADAQRRQQERDAYDAMMQQQEAARHRAAADRREREQARKRQQADKQKAARKRSKAQKTKGSGDSAIAWNSGWAMVGAVGGFILASATMQADPEGALVLAGISGVALGFLWRIVIGVAVLGGIIAVLANL